MIRKALLLVGSPKPSNSTSEAIGDYLTAELQRYDIQSTKLHIIRSLHSDNALEVMLSAINESDIIILSCPLYVDSVPAIVVKAMELIAENRKITSPSKPQALLAISNSGFPEAHHNYPALAVYKYFAQETRFNWAGGLALGSGGAIDGKPLLSLGGMIKNVVKSLDLVALALAQGQPIPEQAIELIEKPMFPNWLYLLVGQTGWYIQAYKFGTLTKLNAQPYRE